jgi:hypothetical protein
MTDVNIKAEGGRPLVVAVPVPWSVSTNVANLAASWREAGQCVIWCDAFFGRHHPAAAYKRVAIHFAGCASLLVEPRVSDDQVIGGDRYDWSGIRRPRPKTEDELTAWLTAYATDWASTGVCPNPHFYCVEPSAWAANFRHGHRHFVIEGTDSHAELLARDFTWVVDSDLPE